MAATKIDWCDVVWNPVTGCSKISAGCDNCYAQNMANRLKGRCGYPASNPFAITLHEDKLKTPLTWKKPRRIFVNSMGDLFHHNVPFEWIDAVMRIIGGSRKHTFMVLTKRPERMRAYFSSSFADGFTPREGYTAKPLPNLWLGVSVEHQAAANERITLLLHTPAIKRFVSVEPMIGPVYLSEYLECSGMPDCKVCDGKRLDWVIVGGETGRKARPCNETWVRTLRDQCIEAHVPFFFKGWGEWAPATEPWQPHPFGIFPDGSYYRGGLLMGPINQEAVSIAKRHEGQTYTRIHRVGKKTAGNIIDGHEWREVPA